MIAEIPALSSLQKWLAEIKISPPAEAKPSLILEVIPKVIFWIVMLYANNVITLEY